MFVLTCLSLLSSLSQVNQFRQLYAKVINDKHDDVMAKFGAILAQGILDAGQTNTTPLRLLISPPNTFKFPHKSQQQQLDLIRKHIHLLVSDPEGNEKSSNGGVASEWV